MNNRKTLPILLTKPHVLLIGAGKVALQKAGVLKYNNISFSIISKTIHPKLKDLCTDIQIKSFKTKDIQNHLIVIDASSNRKVTKKLLKYKKKHPLLLNVVDQPKMCGLGDPSLLTLKAYNILKSADVVLYDHLISDEIMSIVPKKTKKIFVGKEKGFHTKPQDAINKLIHKYIKKDRSIARMKSGDPFIFGRGAEELFYLTQKGINTEVIPGISSAIAAPLMAGIPITASDYSNAFTVVSAHLKGNSINLKWVELLKKKEHTTIVLMGLSRISEIIKESLTLDIDPKIACAIISNASRKNQTIITTTLENLEVSSKKASRPAILVFGSVVDYSKTLKESEPS